MNNSPGSAPIGISCWTDWVHRLPCRPNTGKTVSGFGEITTMRTRKWPEPSAPAGSRRCVHMSARRNGRRGACRSSMQRGRPKRCDWPEGSRGPADGKPGMPSIRTDVFATSTGSAPNGTGMQTAAPHHFGCGYVAARRGLTAFSRPHD